MDYLNQGNEGQFYPKPEPEPYKGKGIKFVGEQLRRKAGKTAAAK